MTNANSAIAKAQASSKTRPVFYTSDKAKVKVSLWRNNTDTPRAPALTGKIGDVVVSGFVRRGEKGAFIGLTGKRLDDGSYENLGTANVRAGLNGYPKLVIKMADGSEVWAETTKEGTFAFLASLGLDVQKMIAKQNAANVAREAKKTEKAAA